jgi:hypothetical protein
MEPADNIKLTANADTRTGRVHPVTLLMVSPCCPEAALALHHHEIATLSYHAAYYDHGTALVSPHAMAISCFFYNLRQAVLVT